METLIQRTKNLYRNAVRSHQKPSHFEMSKASFDKLYSESWLKSPASRCPCKRDVFATLGCLACDDTGRLPEQPLPADHVLFAHDIPVRVVPDEQVDGGSTIRVCFKEP
jgi:hypothetical protein